MKLLLILAVLAVFSVVVLRFESRSRRQAGSSKEDGGAVPVPYESGGSYGHHHSDGHGVHGDGGSHAGGPDGGGGSH